VESRWWQSPDGAVIILAGSIDGRDKIDTDGGLGAVCLVTYISKSLHNVMECKLREEAHEETALEFDKEYPKSLLFFTNENSSSH
jgi:hypothetical protein